MEPLCCLIGENSIPVYIAIILSLALSKYNESITVSIKIPDFTVFYEYLFMELILICMSLE